MSSALNNFITAFFGSLTKTCVNNQIVWTLPCNLEAGVEGTPRVAGEGLACYFLRLLSAEVGNMSVEITDTNDINWELSDVFYQTLDANTVYTFSNEVDSKTISVAITNTAGNFTVSWPSEVQWKTGIEPTQTPGAVTDVYTFINVNGTIYGAQTANMS